MIKLLKLAMYKNHDSKYIFDLMCVRVNIANVFLYISYLISFGGTRLSESRVFLAYSGNQDNPIYV